MGSAPEVRAGWPKLAMRFIKLLPPPPRDAILERLGDERARIREVSFRDFLDLSLFVTLADVTVDVLGLIKARALWCEVMVEALKQPAISEIARRAGVGNRDPVPILKRTADAFHFSHRGCGDWLVTANEEARTAEISVDGAPPAIVESRGMHAAYFGNVSAAFTSVGVDARLSVTVSPEERRIRYRARW